MPTLAQQFREEFREEFMETMGPQLIDKGEKNGIEKKAKETALKMLNRGFDLDTIMDITGLTESEIEALAPHTTSH